MSCCGRKRQAWSVSQAISAQGRPPLPPTLQNPRVLYYVAATSLLINGHVTGFTYLFAGRGSGLGVDERDVPAFLRLRDFQLSPPQL